jgi:hypothetical protein
MPVQRARLLVLSVILGTEYDATLTQRERVRRTRAADSVKLVFVMKFVIRKTCAMLVSMHGDLPAMCLEGAQAPCAAVGLGPLSYFWQTSNFEKAKWLGPGSWLGQDLKHEHEASRCRIASGPANLPKRGQRSGDSLFRIAGFVCEEIRQVRRMKAETIVFYDHWKQEVVNLDSSIGPSACGRLLPPSWLLSSSLKT